MPLFAGSPRNRVVRRVLLVGTTAAATAAALATAPAAAADPENAATAKPDGVMQKSVQKMAADLDISRAEAKQRMRTQDDKDALADRLRHRLDAQSAGAFIDSGTGRLVVNVTSEKAADRVRSTEARPRIVDHSTTRLQEIKRSLQRKAVTGTTLGIDVRSNTVEVTIPQSKSNARTRALVRRAQSFGDAVEITRAAGVPRTTALYGGEAIYGGGVRCSAAFVASTGGTEYVITAGHCTNAASSWSVSEGYLGPTAASSFPGNDYGAIRKDGSVNAVGQVLYGGSAYEITNAGNPPVGTYVCKTGSTTGTTCGYIEQYGVTVNYPSGTVGDLIQTDVCTQSGDSGGALYAGGNQAVGIVSGGTTISCSDPRYTSFFENVTEALNAYGLTLE